MKLWIKIGEYVFEYIILNLLLIVSGILILPTYIGLVSIIVFYEAQTYRSMVEIVKQNFKNLSLLTLIEFSLAALIYLNLQVLSMNQDWFSQLVTYVTSMILVILLVYPPIILLKMRVSFIQLIINTVLLTFSQIRYTIAMFTLSGLMIYLMVYSNWAILLIVPYLQSISYLSNKALQKEKNKKGINHE